MNRLLRTYLTMSIVIGAAFMVASPVSAQYQLTAEKTKTLPLERFRPTIDDKGLQTVEGGKIVDKGGYQLGWIFNYAHNPLVINATDQPGAPTREDREGWLVRNRLGSNLMGTFGLTNWLSLGFDLPIYFWQTSRDFAINGNTGNASDLTFGSTATSGGVGDLRVIPKFNLLGEGDDFLSLAVLVPISLPTGFGINSPRDSGFVYNDNYFNYGGGNEWYQRFTAHPEAALTLDFDKFIVGANLGYRWRHPLDFDIDETNSQILVGSDWTYALGFGIDFSQFDDDEKDARHLVSIELVGATADRAPFGLFVQDDDFTWEDSADFMNTLELMLGYRTDLNDKLVFDAGLGTGVVNGFGVPDWRVFAGVRYAPKAEAAKDTDGDGIYDHEDQCPLEPEDKDDFEDKDGCPDPDNDGDTVLDVDDKCPNKPGSPTNAGCPIDDADGDGVLDADDLCPEIPGTVERKGCPISDKDQDGIPDDQDKCPEQAGPESRQGCPLADKDGDGIEDSEDKCPDVAGPRMFGGCPDTDGDGIPDNVDKCPKEPETINGNEDEDGCPDKGKTLVKLTQNKIEIRESVYFDTAKSTIKERSFNLLNQVATIINHHPEIKKIRVEGHTDSQGGDDYNMQLSKDRAAAVMAYLMEHGVAADHLESEGYGETKPIASNNTSAGRQKNRRVDFFIVEAEPLRTEVEAVKVVDPKE